jgi:hypothetical protein
VSPTALQDRPHVLSGRVGSIALTVVRC